MPVGYERLGDGAGAVVVVVGVGAGTVVVVVGVGAGTVVVVTGANGMVVVVVDVVDVVVDVVVVVPDGEVVVVVSGDVNDAPDGEVVVVVDEPLWCLRCVVPPVDVTAEVRTPAEIAVTVPAFALVVADASIVTIVTSTEDATANVMIFGNR